MFLARPGEVRSSAVWFQTGGLWRHDFIVFAVLEDAIWWMPEEVGESAAA